MARKWMFFAVLLVGVGLTWMYGGDAFRPLSSSAVEKLTTESLASTSSSPADPAKVEGHQKCIDCHRSEVISWVESPHGKAAFDLLRLSATRSHVEKYAKALEIDLADIATSKSTCMRCHGTRQQQNPGHSRVITSVSCEACHNGSGGSDGWLNAHAVYGTKGTSRKQETKEHYEHRLAKCRQAEQLGPEALYKLTKRCLHCHVPNIEALVEAGHPSGDRFELVERFLSKKIRHNFVLDDKNNAEVASLWTDTLRHSGRSVMGRKRVLLVIAQLADLETSFNKLAMATGDSEDYIEVLVDRILGAYELLAEDILEELEDTELPSLEELVEALEEVAEKLDDDGFDSEDKQNYLTAAKSVAETAKTFALRDGNKLEELDDLDLLPEEEEE